MTAGNNGASTPEDDDPFGYLYEDGQAAAANQGRQGGYGYPRTSYNQVRAVGERQYGQQQAPQQPYGQQQGQQPYGQAQQQPYGQAPYGQQQGGQHGAPPAQHGAGGTGQVPAQRGGGRGSGGGPNTKGLLIGAIAVVAVVVIGIAVAVMTNGDGDKKNDTAPTGAPTADQSQQPGDEPGGAEEEPVELPKQDAATLQLSGPASTASDVAGAKSASGAYVSLNAAGAAATWTVEVPEGGAYTLHIKYGVPGKDAKTTLTINDKAPAQSINMANFAHAPEGAWDKGWTNTYAYVNLAKGSNTIRVSCEQGDQCEANLDQLELTAGHGKG
ncbi:carbohydrate-binding protein [Streptomyces sp. NPDC051569]|uniref:carbohydrate-binding protein n=1 Tax=Streptomyces sp. NPDC051569 TaxID=3365661 RepID=UPI00379E116F